MAPWGQILRSNCTVMNWRVMFCHVICIVAWARAPEVAELLLGGAALQPVKFHVHRFEAFTGNVVYYDAKGLGVVGLHRHWGLLMSHFFERVVRWDCFPTVDKSAPSSTSAADDMTFLMICAMVRTARLLGGSTESFDMKKYLLARLRALVSER